MGIISQSGFLYQELRFPHGAYLMTGTGIVPGAEFTLNQGDRIEIQIPDRIRRKISIQTSFIMNMINRY